MKNKKLSFFKWAKSTPLIVREWLKLDVIIVIEAFWNVASCFERFSAVSGDFRVRPQIAARKPSTFYSLGYKSVCFEVFFWFFTMSLSRFGQFYYYVLTSSITTLLGFLVAWLSIGNFVVRIMTRTFKKRGSTCYIYL